MRTRQRAAFTQGAMFGGMLVSMLAFVGTVFATSYTPWLAVGDGPTAGPSAPAGPGVTAQTLSETAEASDSGLAVPSYAPETTAAALVSDPVDATVSETELARALADLKAAGVPATAAELRALAAKVGLGNAIRVVVFAFASGRSTGTILAMFESGQGWGRIADELDLTIGPGIGGVVLEGSGLQGSERHTPASATAAPATPAPTTTAQATPAPSTSASTHGPHRLNGKP